MKLRLNLLLILALNASLKAATPPPLPPPVAMACMQALSKFNHVLFGGPNPQVKNEFLDSLPNGKRHFFEEALKAMGEDPAKINAKKLARNVLVDFDQHERNALYDVLGYDSFTRSKIEVHVQKTLKSQEVGPVKFTAIFLKNLIVFYSVGILFQNIIKDQAANLSRSFSDYMCEKKMGFPSKVFTPDLLKKQFNLNESNAQYPSEIIFGNNRKFKQKIKANLINGRETTIYDAVDPKDPVAQIIINNNKVKNVHDGFDIIVAGKDENGKQYYFDKGGKFLRATKCGGNSVVPEESLLNSGLKSDYQKLVPPLAKVENYTGNFENTYTKDLVGDEVVVALLDSGIDYNRSDLVRNLKFNTKEIPGNGIDDDNNGYVDDYIGYDFSNKVPYTHSWPNNYHGSYVAQRVISDSSSIKILPLKKNSFNTGKGELIEAYSYIKNWNMDHPNEKIRVVNLSFASSSPSYNEYLAIKENPDVLFVASAGNDKEGSDYDHAYPSEYALPNLISVASFNRDNFKLSEFSGRGKNVEFIAEGENVESTNAYGHSKTIEGTSYSSPEVAGIAAKILRVNPALRPEEVREVIAASVEYKESLKDTVKYSGVINVEKALALAIKAKQSVSSKAP